MLFKKKQYGTVTVYEDNPPESFDDFSDLKISKPDKESDLDELSRKEFETLALTTANTGKEGTSRALRVAIEAREIGINTATQLHQQTEQLEKMADDIEEVHDCLDRSERIIDKMATPKLLRLFKKNKPTGKGLDRVKAGRDDLEERQAKRNNGISAIDMDGMKNYERPEYSESEDVQYARQDLFDGITVTDYKKRGFKLFKKKNNYSDINIDVADDYSQYSKPVADVMRQQDADLDEISHVLNDMKDIAGAMNNELEYQEAVINQVTDYSVETSRRTRKNADKISKLN